MALNDVNLSFGNGVTALVGSNGAGKTTFLSLIATMIRPTSGTVEIDGHPLDSVATVEDARRLIGYLPQSFDLLRGASVAQNVEYSAWVHGVSGADLKGAVTRALDLVDLGSKADHKSKTLSGGQRQRLGIACSVAHRPQIVLLDEPTVGLDPAQRVGVRRLVTEIGDEAAVILSTHLVEDVAAASRRTVVLKEGQVAFDGATASLSGASGSVDGSAEALERSLLELM